MDLRALSSLPSKTSWVGKTQRGTGPLRTPPAVSGLGREVMESQPVGLSAVGAF